MSREVPINDLARWEVGEIEEILDAVRMVCERGNFMLGPSTRRFESDLANFLGAEHVISVANGTDALTLALIGLDISSGDVVATSANAGGYTSTAAIRIGAQPLPIDVDPLTGQMDPESLQVALQSHPGVKAVVITHLYGLVGRMDEIVAICSRMGIPLIEDCAQAIGAKWKGCSVGTFGDIGTFSFYPTKNLGALGDGGALTTNSEVLAQRIRQLAQYGWGERYSVEIPRGFNSRLDEIQAAVLSLRLLKLDAANSRRRTIVKRYAKALTNGRYMLYRDDDSFVAHLAVMVTDSRAADRASLALRGIGTAIHYPLIDSDHPGWQSLVLKLPCPNASRLVSSVVTLPCFPSMSEGEIDLVCDSLARLDD